MRFPDLFSIFSIEDDATPEERREGSMEGGRDLGGITEGDLVVNEVTGDVVEEFWDLEGGEVFWWLLSLGRVCSGRVGSHCRVCLFVCLFCWERSEQFVLFCGPTPLSINRP